MTSNDQMSTREPRFAETLIIGGGLAGLACAVRLSQQGRECLVLEATDRVGGRVRTDHVDGFTLDHGFQVLLTAYPACCELLDYEALRLRPFEPGALIRQNGRFCVLSDPWRRPFKTLATAMNPVGSIGDKLRIAKLRRASRKGSLRDLYRRPTTSTIERLRQNGFSERMIDQFFRPFLGGVFLDESLATSSQMLEFVFRMFSAGDIAVPAGGMSEIPRQLADQLPRGTLRFQTTVRSLQPVSDSKLSTNDGYAPRNRVELSDGSWINCQHVVVATPSNTTARLLAKPEMETQWTGTTNLYFAADRLPESRKFLILRGDETGPIQSAVVLSDVAPSYAPVGRALISVSVAGCNEPADGLDDGSVEANVRSQLKTWFGGQVSTWEHLRTYRVPYALPVVDLQAVMGQAGSSTSLELPGVYVAGDHQETPSINGALNSGLQAANAILAG